jgi:hypothetical protein
MIAQMKGNSVCWFADLPYLIWCDQALVVDVQVLKRAEQDFSGVVS